MDESNYILCSLHFGFCGWRLRALAIRTDVSMAPVEVELWKMLHINPESSQPKKYLLTLNQVDLFIVKRTCEAYFITKLKILFVIDDTKRNPSLTSRKYQLKQMEYKCK